MALTVMDPHKPPNPQKVDHFIGENYELALNQSIEDLLDSHRKASCDFSALTSTFCDLMQARANPPLETIWVYSALKFRHTNSPKNEPLDRVSATKDLFQLISGCSASCSSSKSIALLAPVIYEVYGVIVDSKGKDLGSKREKKVMREMKSLVDSILGFISVCCGVNDDIDGLGSDSNDFIRPLENLIRVWVDDGVDENSEGTEGFKLFFPLLSDDIVEWLRVGGIDVSELAGAVIMEAFLLRLCLDFRGVPKQELQKELRTWAVGSITGFRHFYFFETLVRMLLECSLPVTYLLSSEDNIFLRKVLYDTVILVEYSFLNPDEEVHLPPERIKRLAMGRLIVTHEAVELFRANGDQTKAICYINAFSSSKLPSQLIKLVKSEIGVESKASRPKGSSPKAFFKWLVNLEDQGIRIFDDGIAKYHAKLALDSSEAEFHQLASKTEGKQLDADLFYIDNKGEGEDGNEEDERSKESMSAAFMAAAHTMAFGENEGRRKRKEAGRAEKKKPVKFLKYNLHDNSGSSGEKSAFRRTDGSSSGSEVENPISDEDSEENDK